jgi:hypothetical protein
MMQSATLSVLSKCDLDYPYNTYLPMHRGMHQHILKLKLAVISGIRPRWILYIQ